MKSGGAEELAAKRHGDNGETQWLWRLVTATVMVVTMAAMAMVTAAMTVVYDGMARVRGRRGSWGRSLTSAEAPMAAGGRSFRQSAIAVQRAERATARTTSVGQWRDGEAGGARLAGASRRVAEQSQGSLGQIGTGTIQRRFFRLIL